MELIDKVIARMRSEEAASASESEIIRCLSGCVSAKKLIAFAIENRLKLCFEFCGADESSEGERVFPCGCKSL